jgi:hypothetical protein
MKRLWIQQYQRLTSLQIIGIVLLFIGIIILIGIGIATIFETSTSALIDDESTLVAIAFLFIMLAIALIYPDMLKSPDNSSYSVMRIAVFMIVSLFSFLVAKIGWNCKSMADFQVHSGWAAIISATLGSKAIQSLGENNVFGKKPPVVPSSTNAYFSTNGPPPNPPVHNAASISHKPPPNAPTNISFNNQ